MTAPTNKHSPDFFIQLKNNIQQWSLDAGFQQMLITDVNLQDYQQYYQDWLDNQYHGDMSYMQRNVDKRLQPALLHEGTLRCISFRMDYLPDSQSRILMEDLLQQPDKAYISRYALGRDYHKLIRKRLSVLANKIQQQVEQTLNQRAFVDSAPVLERALAEKAGMGWIGKNTMLINKKAGSYFFLAEILTDLPLPIDKPEEEQMNHCGSCQKCLDVCPTKAFTGPNQLDARRCISYLTIELHGSIPLELRPLIGNRIYGCDDCQIFCPWNKFNQTTAEVDFSPRQQLDDSSLLTLFGWSESEFLDRTAGSPIRRIGYQRWLRNLAVGLGNAHYDVDIINTLHARLQAEDLEPMAIEHMQWAIEQQKIKKCGA
ncbi:MAG: tRNA epoxyqueuosine(34) reductase QueG [Pseudomonadales bacterium]|nr:tRNA epoxyqueuosine(34) reductase QueG [Pseudomonadales bacterium]